jgi:hypothetical protein
MYSAYMRAAQQLKLTIEPENPGAISKVIHLHGEYGGVRIDVERIAGENARITRAFLDPPARIGMVIARAGLINKIEALRDHEDHIVGDPPFDDEFIVQAHDVEAVKRILTDEVKQALWVLHGTGNEFALMDGHVDLRRLLIADQTETMEAIESDLRVATQLATKANAALAARRAK